MEAVQLCDNQVLDVLYEAVEDSLVRIIDLFIEDFSNNIISLRQALDAKDYETIARTAHSLKSSCANLGVMQLAAVAIEIEQLVKADPGNAALLEKQFARLEQVFVQTKPKLLEYKTKISQG